MKNIITKKKIKEIGFITIGVILVAFSFSFFLNPNNIVIGGVSGLGVIFKYVTGGYDPSILMLVVNIALLVLGFVFVSKEFVLKTAYGALTFPIFVRGFNLLAEMLTEKYNQFDATKLDMVLVIAFSSIIMGLGLGVCVKHGGSTGGTEIPQRILFKFFHMPYSVSLYILDGVVILAGLLVVKNLDLTLYSIIFTYVSGVVMDTVVFSGFNKRAVYIISNKKEDIKKVLLDDFQRGVTSIKVIGEYSKEEKTMLVCVLSTMEYFKLRTIIETHDPRAFYYVVRANEVRGEGFSYASEDI